LNVAPKYKETSNTTLLDHPFTTMLAGHPQAITLAAALLEYKSLKELFHDFCKSNVVETLESSQNNQKIQNSLKVSLELSLSQVSKTCKQAIDLFSFISFFPGGISGKEIDSIWDDKNWYLCKDALIRASLLTYKRIDGK
jgi:hypothetical protein